MTKREKRLQKMRQNPKKVSYNDYVAILNDYDFTLRIGQGSRRTALIEIDDEAHIIAAHEPHGKNKYMHPKAVKRLLNIIELIESKEEEDE